MIRVKLLPGAHPEKVNKNQINYSVIVADLQGNPIDTLYINQVHHYIFGANRQVIDAYDEGQMSMGGKITNFFGDPFNNSINEFLAKFNMVWDEEDRINRFNEAKGKVK